MADDNTTPGRPYLESMAGTHPRTREDLPVRIEGTFSDPDFRQSLETTADGEKTPSRSGVPVRDVMTGRIGEVHPNDNLREAAERMRGLDVGFLPVVDGGCVVGVLTDRDITVRSTAAGLDPNRERVREVMSTDVATCYEDQDIVDAFHLMKERQLHRLVVLSRTDTLVGVITLGDLSLGGGDSQRTGETLKGITDPDPRP